MNWKLLKQRLLPAARGGTARFTLPTSVLEIEPDFVVGARLEGSGRAQRRLRRVAARQLESPALEPHANRSNIVNAEALRRAVRELGEVIGDGSGRYGLVVPDRAVRIGVIAFETLPDDLWEAESLVHWRMRANLPFNPGEARLTFQVLSREPGAVEVLAVAIKGSVLAEYEGLLDQMNGGPALILPATVTLLPLLPEEGVGQLLVHVCAGCVTTAVVAGRRVCAWRDRELGHVAPGELTKEVASEAARVVASARDHLKMEMGRVWLCARPPATAELTSALAGAMACDVQILAPTPELAMALPSEDRRIFEHFGAPVAGLVANAG